MQGRPPVLGPRLGVGSRCQTLPHQQGRRRLEEPRRVPGPTIRREGRTAPSGEGEEDNASQHWPAKPGRQGTGELGPYHRSHSSTESGLPRQERPPVSAQSAPGWGAFSTEAVYTRPMQSVGDSGGSWAEYAPRFHQAIEQEFVSVKPRAVGLFFSGIDMIGIGARKLGKRERSPYASTAIPTPPRPDNTPPQPAAAAHSSPPA